MFLFTGTLATVTMAQTAHELYDITNTIYSKGGGHMTTTVQSDDSGCDLMDDSLTDMQWLQRMDAGTPTCTC